jgi:glycosyltransferase involved in cell wall biosynthesis
MRQADAIGISTEAWLEEWSRRTPAFGQKFRLLPSPATVPVAPIAPSFGLEWRTSQGWPASTQVMTFFGSVGRSKQIEWALEAWKQVQRPEHPVGLVLIGERPNVIVPVESARFQKALGFLPSEEVSRLLQVTDVLVLPFVDGVSERRTSFMAGLSHGRAVATTVGHNTGTTLRRAAFFAAADCRQRGEFVNIVSGLLADADRRSRLGAAARDAYARQYDWPTVVNSLAGMGSPGSQARP